MTEWNNPAELGSNTSTTKPCDACPAIVWGFIRDPATREGEQAIRAAYRHELRSLLEAAVSRGDQMILARRLTDTSLRRDAGLLVHLLNQILEPEAA